MIGYYRHRITILLATFELVTGNLSLKASVFDDFMNKYTLSCPSVRKIMMSYENELLEFENYEKEYLPSVYLNLTPVSFNRSLKLLQNYVDGGYNYVKDYSYTGNTSLYISQKIGITGGMLSAGTSLDYLCEFTTKRNSFNTSPLYVSYNQPLRGGYRQYKYSHDIQHLRHGMSLQKLCQSVSTVQKQILSLYLSAYLNKLQHDMAVHNMCTGDTLLRLAKLKMDNGFITRFDYNKIELQQLQTKNSERQAKYGLDNAIIKLKTKLGVTEDIAIEAPDPSSLPESLDYGVVIEMVKSNNPQMTDLELQQKLAQYERYTTMLQTHFNGNISLSYGLNQYARTLAQAYRHPDERQSVSITLSIPLYQWGILHNKRRMAENKYNSSAMSLEETRKEFENSIIMETNNYNMARDSYSASLRNMELTKEQYGLAVTRFEAGKISVYELTQAYDAQLTALNKYFDSIRQIFVQYYDIRHLTLFDFTNNRKLTDEFIAYEKE